MSEQSMRCCDMQLLKFLTYILCLTKLQKRLIQMGENKKNIFIVGSPDVDVILAKNLPNLDKVKKRYEINFKKFAIGIIHPVTTNLKNLQKETKIFF